MASPAETLAANLNFSAFSKATELKSRIWFTLLALIVYRAGTYIPVPGLIRSCLDRFSKHTPAAFWECLICSRVVP